MILGLDASSTCIGWAINSESVILDAGYLTISKFNSNKEKSLAFIKFIKENKWFDSITEIKIESPLFGFLRGKTSQQTIITLIKFNAIFEYILSEELQIPLTLINVSTARKKVLGKARIKGLSGKEYVRQQIDLKFSYVHQFDKLNSKGKWDSKNENIYDAVIIAMS